MYDIIEEQNVRNLKEFFKKLNVKTHDNRMTMITLMIVIFKTIYFKIDKDLLSHHCRQELQDM